VERHTEKASGVAILEEAGERSSDERSETERSGGASSKIARLGVGGVEASPAAPPDPEVPARPKRRRYTAEYKREILKQADACIEPGQLGALLRREGLYHSNLITWRRQREEGTLKALSPKKRGRKAHPKNPLAARVAELEREKRKLEKRLKQAETIIEIQKKTSELLGIPLNRPSNDEND
jgi:transposase-like protein